MNASEIKWLHAEISSKCNAWCPGCSRSVNGYGLAPGLIEQDLSLARFKEVIEQLPNLEVIQLCGNYGDPIIAKDILEFVKISKQHAKKIQIHTNGGLRSTKWWSEFAKLLSDIDHDVWFGIDGIGKTHEIYRQGTNYDKVIKNATAFIDAGGTATWQFIPYAHNEHQIKEAHKLSIKLKFKKFKLIKQFRDHWVARHYKTGEYFTLSPAQSIIQIVSLPKVNSIVEPKNCMHLSLPSIYLNADGTLSQCCYYGDSMKVNSVDAFSTNPADLTTNLCLTNCGS